MLVIIILSCKKVSQNEGGVELSPPFEGQDACHCVYALVQHGFLLLLFSFLLILDLLHPYYHLAL